MKFIKDGFSISEFKISSLVICLFATIGYGIYKYHVDGDITNNFVQIILTLVYVIGGVNGVHVVSNLISETRDVKKMVESATEYDEKDEYEEAPKPMKDYFNNP